jgi:hypothetical protein
MPWSSENLWVSGRADEFYAMLIIAEERDLLAREKVPGSGSYGVT